MPHSDPIPQLIALLDRWNDLVVNSAQKIKSADNSTQGGFYTGVMFGMETARDELATVLAHMQYLTVQADKNS